MALIIIVTKVGRLWSLRFRPQVPRKQFASEWWMLGHVVMYVVSFEVLRIFAHNVRSLQPSSRSELSLEGWFLGTWEFSSFYRILAYLFPASEFLETAFRIQAVIRKTHNARHSCHGRCHLLNPHSAIIVSVFIV